MIKKYNAAVEDMELVAAKFNEQVRAYKDQARYSTSEVVDLLAEVELILRNNTLENANALLELFHVCQCCVDIGAVFILLGARLKVFANNAGGTAYCHNTNNKKHCVH